MTTYYEKITELAETVKIKADAPRWKHQNSPTIQGELTAIIQQHGFKPTPNSIKALAEIFKMVNKSPHIFYVNDNKRNFSANLGKILHQRVNGLKNPENEADLILKSWLKSDTEIVVSKHIPRLVNYTSQSIAPINIPLNDLIALTFTWDTQPATAITNIATNYYMKEENK